MYSSGDYEREVSLQDGQEQEWREAFSRDYGRIIHSASFRRLQGKTQVFPTNESDFFRNRLTHSLEVAQIAEGIAEQLNHTYKQKLQACFRAKNAGSEVKEDSGLINGTICATAGLIHDMGHPPFGHNGERALDRAMRRIGGFEGNAQTLRILTKLEKKKKYKEPLDGDDRAGFDLCYRTLAASLKYDKLICPIRSKKVDKLAKGYYYTEKNIVTRIKKAVLNGYVLPEGKKFQTIECAIMDLADDIAYSVYDLEDCLKAEFVTPAGIISGDYKLLEVVSQEVSKKMKREITNKTVIDVFTEVFGFDKLDNELPEALGGWKTRTEEFGDLYRASQLLCHDAYHRTRLSSWLVHSFIKSVELTIYEDCPALSEVNLPDKLKLRLQVLKAYTYYAAIYSPRVKMGEYRGDELVTDIFEALMGEKGQHLMPNDVRRMFTASKFNHQKARVVCDFVAGMTDRYAIEFWSRLKSNDPESIFKPI